nr:hypothetical protein [Clostridia bacterium]
EGKRPRGVFDTDGKNKNMTSASRGQQCLRVFDTISNIPIDREIKLTKNSYHGETVCCSFIMIVFCLSVFIHLLD